jgi:hypothetical protein
MSSTSRVRAAIAVVLAFAFVASSCKKKTDPPSPGASSKTEPSSSASAEPEPSARSKVSTLTASADFSGKKPKLSGLRIDEEEHTEDRDGAKALTKHGAELQLELDVKDVPAKAYIELSHRSEEATKCEEKGWTQITVSMNGADVVSDFVITKHEAALDAWDITKHVVHGKNEISIEVDDGCAPYLIENISLGSTLSKKARL